MLQNLFQNKIAHKQAVLSLYRSLLRKAQKLSHTSISSVSDEQISESISKEIIKSKLDAKLYVQYLSSELLYAFKEEFRPYKKRYLDDPNHFSERFIMGIELNSCLEGILSKKEESWTQLLQRLIAYRESKFREQQWRAEYLENKELIDQKRNKEKPPLLLKQIASRAKPLPDPLDNFPELSHRDKIKKMKAELSNSTLNAHKVLRRHLKKLQMNHEIPIPQLLPYTPDKVFVPVDQAVKSSLTIPGSTKHSSIESAYDLDYIEAIIKPDIEFDINKYHYLDHLREIANEKGPFKVQINMTDAGPMSIPYIKMPYPRLQELKEVALDIKKSLRLIRLKTIWGVSTNDNSVTEPKFADGSYSVRGSRGFGEEERVRPRYYYDNLAKGEGLWEYFIEKEISKKNDNAEERQINEKDVIRELNELKQSHIKEWTDSLDLTTNELNSELDSYFQKYKVLKSANSPLFEHQKHLQHKMNSHYDFQLNRYKQLIEQLKEKNIFKHSELVNFGDAVTKTYEKYLTIDNGIPKKKNRKGIPELERIGMGKKLGDYLDDSGYHNFKMGENFVKKFKF